MVFSVVKALGRHFYGTPRKGDDGYKGYHFTPYEPRLYFYDPDELAQVARGTKRHYEVVPYATFRPGEYFWPGPNRFSIADMAYDRQNGLLYIGWPPYDAPYKGPLLHVFRIASKGTAPAGTGTQQRRR